MTAEPDRRIFNSVVATAPLATQTALSGTKRKLCVIGATGRGDYGHGLDLSLIHI